MTLQMLNSHPCTASDLCIGQHRLEHFYHLRKLFQIVIMNMNLKICGNKHPFFISLAKEWDGESRMKNKQFSV